MSSVWALTTVIGKEFCWISIAASTGTLFRMNVPCSPLIVSLCVIPNSKLIELVCPTCRNRFVEPSEFRTSNLSGFESSCSVSMVSHCMVRLIGALPLFSISNSINLSTPGTIAILCGDLVSSTSKTGRTLISSFEVPAGTPPPIATLSESGTG